MTRVQSTVLWTLAMCVFGYIAVHVLIVKAPGAAQAQQPATDPLSDKPLPEDDPKGLGAERPAPAPALEPARALVAICVGDNGEPLDDVIVDIFRETPSESPFDPRVESVGRTKTTDDGRLAVSLPLIQGKTKEGEAAAMYLFYFSAPGRPIKSMIVKNGTQLPKQIVIPTKSTEHIYAPTHHIVVAKTKGISVSPLHSAIRAFTKDGKIYRVEGFVDERNDGKAPASGNGASLGLPGGNSAQMGMRRPGSGQSSQQTAQEQILAARKRLTDATSDEEKHAARAVLRKLLADVFAQDMQMREKQAMEIEIRLAKLRQQYEARQKVKEEIIDLQLKVIEQHAAGLGFPGGQSSVPPTANGRDDVYEPAAAPQTRGDEAAATEFSELRKQYLQAKGRWAEADTKFSVLLAKARKQNPKTSIDDVKKLHLDAWRENEQALRNYVAARHLIETKLELLELDLKSAKLSVEVAESNLVDLIQKHKDKAALEAEVDQQRAAVKAAMLDVEQVTQLIKLFTSVKSEPVPTSDARPTDAGGGDKAS